jgi:membrane protein YqaA with SNARE-associated domain
MQAFKVGSETQSYGTGQLAVRLGATLASLLLATLALSHFLKPQLQSVAGHFYDHFGAWGAAIGTWLADGFNAPIPPQAYMLLAEAHGAGREVFPAIVAGSLVGGVTGYLVAPVLMRFRWIRALIERTQPKVRALCDRRWILAGLVLSVSPVPFSWLCYSASLYRVPVRTLGLLCLLRVPKLAVYQLLITWGWS